MQQVNKHTSVTVEVLIDSGCLGEVDVLAGSRGLKRQVRHLTVLSTPDPWDWLEGNEMVLTTGYFAGGNSQTLFETLKRLIDKGISAFCYKEDRHMPPISIEMLELADKNNLPIIRLSKDIRWIDILTPVYTLLTQTNQASLKNIQLKTTRLFFHNLLDQPVITLEEATRIAESLALPLHPAYILTLMPFDRRKPQDVTKRINESLTAAGLDCVFLKHNGHLVVISPRNEADLSADQIENTSRHLLDIVHSAGYPPNLPFAYPLCTAALNQLRQHYIEGVIALSMLKTSKDKATMIPYDNASVLGLLLSTQDTDTLVSYARSRIGALVELEEQGQVLMDTARTYHETNFSIKQTADILSVHPSTVKYRMGRLNEILGIDPRNFKEKMELYFAIKTWEILGEIEPDFEKSYRCF
jgi:purine catabolism regulator